MNKKSLAVQAPAVTTAEEAKMERFAHLIVFGDEDGGGLSLNEARRLMGITNAEAKRWWASHVVQDYVRSALDSIRQSTELKVAKEVDAALNLLSRVITSPKGMYDKTQIDAAKTILSLHMRNRGETEAQVALQVVVNTNMAGDDAVEAQRRRSQRRESREQVAEGVFNELE